MNSLHSEIKNCKACANALPHSPNPVLAAHPKAKMVIVGQAPGTKVHATGIPWNDLSGKQLRKWLDIEHNDFYNETKVAIVPMGFCYPGKGKSGDLPPRRECAPLWHEKLLEGMPDVELILLIGQYAQKYYLNDTIKSNLTETVRGYREYLPIFFPLPHPSPRNGFWVRKNPWFEKEVIPVLQEYVKRLISRA
jgi:uracil-DNA glycosylase